jgi:hypothetical protein
LGKPDFGPHFVVLIDMLRFFAWALGGLILIHFHFSWADATGRVSLSQVGLVSPDYSLSEKKDFNFISTGLDTLTRAEHESDIEDRLHAQIRGMIVPGLSVLNYLDISQLFWKEQIFSVGRKKVAWSRLDEDFKLGIYQPLFKWNPLQYDSQGLTGIFIHMDPEATAIPWSVTLFGSPIYIPNQGPGFEVKNGKFEENNPYFSNPPTTAMINGQKTEFVYSINKPEINEVINQESFAGRFEFGNSNQGLWMSAAYAQKPANELNLGFQGVLTPDQKIDTQILPKVMYHNVASGELRFKGSIWAIGVEALRDSPQVSDFERPWTYAVYSDVDLFSTYLQINWKNLDLQFSSLTSEGGEMDFIGPRANEAANVLIPRLPFKSAYLLKGKYIIRLKKFENIGLQTSYLRGAQGEFDVWNSTLNYQFKDRWSSYLTSQLVAVKPVEASEKSAFHSFENNDLLALGVSYVF